jgi:hypothetical protein
MKLGGQANPVVESVPVMDWRHLAQSSPGGGEKPGSDPGTHRPFEGLDELLKKKK